MESDAIKRERLRLKKADKKENWINGIPKKLN